MFRAWDKKEKEWLHSYDELGGCSILGETIILGEWMSGIPIERLNDIVVMQFTGQTDKNDKEVYEGDIFTHKEDVFVVEPLREGAFWAVTKDFNKNKLPTLISPSVWGSYEDLEIIGNIYENKELLNGS